MKGGNKWWTWSLPFVTKNWYRRSILMNNGRWAHETPKHRKDFYADDYKNNRMSWQYDYKDSYDGEIIPTTIYVREMEWRPKWFMWTNAFAIVSTMIDVEFSKECGNRKGSWKGGTLGCDYEMKKGESALDCLKRMERDRKF